MEVKLSSYLRLINEPKVKDGCVLTKKFGNITADTKIFSFEYALKDKEELDKIVQKNWFDLESYSF